MKSLLFLLLIWSIHDVYSENIDSVVKALPSAISNEKQEGDEQDKDVKTTLSPEKLQQIFDLAKNISHSKGIFTKADETELRRSIVRKFMATSESDLMRAILSSFEFMEDKLFILEQLEDLVHDYDVAVNFANSGGIEVISPLLFSTDTEIVSSVALVLGAAMQSNPIVQESAMKQHVGLKLLYLLRWYNNFNKSPTVVSRIMFALSCYLRTFPEGQEEFLSLNGVSRLAEILNNLQTASSIKLKIINLFEDLVVEQETAERHQDGPDAFTASLRRSFATVMQKFEICNLIVEFLTSEDHITYEKIISTILSLDGICRKEFERFISATRLQRILKAYELENSELSPSYHEVMKRVFAESVTLQENSERVNETQYPPKDEL